MEESTETIDRMVEAAAVAAVTLATSTPDERGRWLVAVADALDAAADELVPLAEQETHLPARPRLAGELARTTFQLRLFAEVLADGAFLDARVDHADPAWPMGPRPDIRRVKVPIGPVLVFAASNFPFAFSVAGGDTASALAAGCPVILKAHPGHPRLSERTGEIVREALRSAGAPEGVFSVIVGVDAGVHALRHAKLAAASFTGSVAGGRALFDIANARPVPIPFYGELGSVNPVVVTPGAAQERGAEVATGFVGSFTLGTGQFCTKPGLLFVPEGHGMEDALRTAVEGATAGQMLTGKIQEGFAAGLAGLREVAGMRVIAGEDGPPTLLAISAADFAAGGTTVHEECFGPSSIVVEYPDVDSLIELLKDLEPGLTATVHGEETEGAFLGGLLPVLAELSGRLLWNDWPTGVTVSWAQQHGGPYPATTTPTTTSVGTAAIERFLRPVAWQGFPDALLPPALKDANPWRLPRRVDGKVS